VHIGDKGLQIHVDGFLSLSRSYWWDEQQHAKRGSAYQVRSPVKLHHMQDSQVQNTKRAISWNRQYLLSNTPDAAAQCCTYYLFFFSATSLSQWLNFYRIQISYTYNSSLFGDMSVDHTNEQKWCSTAWWCLLGNWSGLPLKFSTSFCKASWKL
jgi:hypothetical protein